MEAVGITGRAGALLARMTLEEKAGLLFQPMIGIGPGGELAAADDDYGLLAAGELVLRRGVNHVNLVGTGSPAELANWQNRLQELASRTRLGIPVTVSSDPRHARSANPATGELAGTFSQWPEPLGLAAVRDPALVGRFADVVRREYLAVGLRVALHPQADLATQPKWPRVFGTFGEDVELTCALVAAYVTGLQGSRLGPTSVAAMTKHFPGGGPEWRGEDAHFRYGRDQVYPGGRFAEHLRPFQAALDAGTSQVMTGYGLPRAAGLPEVAFSFNKDVVAGLLRGRMGFDGVVCADWGVLTDAWFRGQPRPARAWGVEHLSPAQRLAVALDAGVDQFGGEACPDLVVQLVRDGTVSERRLDESAYRLLREKFTLGLFDNPYVDPDAAEQTVGSAEFRAAGLDAQRASVTLLKNAEAGSPARLPLRPGTRVYAEGLSTREVARLGTAVASPRDADVAVLRLQAPYEHRAGTVEAYFHAGPLDFPDAQLRRLLALAGTVPTIVDVYLDRPAVMPELAARVAALVVTFAASDTALVDVLCGAAAPRGRLPFDLPRSMASVEAARPDVAFDLPDPLFRYGHGLSY